jgi:serine/threonine protein kinase
MQSIINSRYALLGDRPVSGGMADVYKASDLGNDGQIVAVKMFQDFAGSKHDPGLLEEAYRREFEHLKALRHENIVELLDTGSDEASGRRFLVLPWMETDLETWLQNENNGFEGWDDYYERMGRSLLEAIAFVHGRNYAHRDLKPRNILMSAEGVPKITDFGISKFKEWAEPGVTLAVYGSPPYTPPEQDDGSYTFSRDVFGFAAISIKCLTKAEFNNLGDLYDAMEGADFDPPDEVVPIINKCLDQIPRERYRDARILFTDLENVWRKRDVAWSPKRTVYVRLSQRALTAIKNDHGIKDDATVREFYVRDLNSICGVKKLFFENKPGEIHFELFSESLASHAKVDKDGYLFIFNVKPMSCGVLSNIREKTWVPDENFKFSTSPGALAPPLAADLDVFVIEADKKFAQMELEQRQREEEGEFDKWARMLNMQVEFERETNFAIRFTERAIYGRRVTFRTDSPLTEELLDQNRIVYLKDGSKIRGIVDGVSEGQLTFFVPEDEASAIPDSGKLEFDSWAARLAVNRQKDALDALRFDQAVNPLLKTLLAKPETASTPQPKTDVLFFNSRLDDAKQTGVNLVLGSDELTLVKGPPGTGKTTFITEIILQHLKMNPDARILLASQTHVALDNCVEGLSKADEAIKLIRVASTHTEKRVNEKVRPNLLREKVDTWGASCIASGQSFLEKWSEDHSIPSTKIQTGQLVREFIIAHKKLLLDDQAALKISESVMEFEGDEGNTTREARDAELGELRTQLADIKKSRKKTVEELASLEARIIGLEADAKEFLTWGLDEIEGWYEENYAVRSDVEKKFLDLHGIHAEWREQFGRREEFKIALLASVNVVAGTCLGIASVRGFQDLTFDLCIVDEASKATPPETLIPLVRSKKWVLVGDEKQLSPFQMTEMQDSRLLEKFDLRKEDFKTSLFSHMSDKLPRECVVTLDTQHRMVAPIGHLVSECFYEGLLNSNGPEVDPTLVEVFRKPVTWFSTTRLNRRFETPAGQSFLNSTEAQQIGQMLRAINAIASQRGKRYRVAVIAGYLAQKDEIENAIARVNVPLDALNLEVNTVDAFQGREADILIYSVTRSNEKGNIGFLRENERINVALSRGRYYLALVGDHRFCAQVAGENPFKAILSHFDLNPDECRLETLAEISGR